MKRFSRGFTLVEMVMTIVILGIVAGVLAPVIVQLTSSFVFTRNQADLTARGRIALERIAREVRYAVPNTLRVIGGGTGIEFVRVKVFPGGGSGGGTYVHEADNFGGSFVDMAKRFPMTPASRTALYAVAPGLAVTAGNDVLVIGNTGPGDFDLGTSRAAFGAIIAPVPADNAPAGSVVLSFGAHTFGNSFSGNRLVVADNSVEIGVTGTDLRWHSVALGGGKGDYNGAVNWSGADPLLVNGVVPASTSFSYAAGTPTAAGVLQIQLALTEGGSTVTLYQEVQVRNTP